MLSLTFPQLLTLWAVVNVLAVRWAYTKETY